MATQSKKPVPNNERYLLLVYPAIPLSLLLVAIVLLWLINHFCELFSVLCVA